MSDIVGSHQVDVADQSLALLGIAGGLTEHLDEVRRTVVDDRGVQRILFDVNQPAFDEGTEVLHRPAFNNHHRWKVDCVRVSVSSLLVVVHHRCRHRDLEADGFPSLRMQRHRNVETDRSIRLDHL